MNKKENNDIKEKIKLLKDVNLNVCSLKELGVYYILIFDETYINPNADEKEQKLEMIKALRTGKKCKTYYIDGELR